MNNSSSFFQKFSQWLKESLAVKLFAIGFLIILLLIPISMIQSSIHERQDRQKTVIREISNDWGGSQNIVGPVLSVPYSKWIEYDNGTRIEEQHVGHFLPFDLDVTGSLEHQIRKRGIFDVVLYQASLQLNGTFEQPDFSNLHVNPENVQWEQAKLSVGISGMSGIKDIVRLDWGGQQFRMESGTAHPDILTSGVSISVPLQRDGNSYSFSIPLKLNGSDHLWVEPVGKTTSVNLTSDWHSPSFDGAFLPDQREISDSGFSANWQILDLNRNYPQFWSDTKFKPGQAGFGVRLLKPVDEYLKNTRSVKYGILVIGLTFLIFFFFEVLRRLLIHPFQYLLIGLALTVFYLLLLSLSEHIGFNSAYITAAAATVGLINGYSLSVLKFKNLVFQLTFLLGAIYGFIFVVLQLEDYALLAGSVGIFIALAAVMYYSRNVDWYQLGKRGTDSEQNSK